MQPSGAAEDVLPEIGFYFTDRAPRADADDSSARIAGHRHSAGRVALRDSRFVRAAGRRAVAGDAAARALPRQGDSRHRARCPTAPIAHGDAHQRLGLPLAARLSRGDADRAAEGHAAVDGYTYDNSAANPRNPELPPARVFWGQRSRDEMGDLWFQLLASNDADRARLSAEITAKMTGEDIVGYETMLKVTPERCRAARRCGAAVSGDGLRGERGAALPGVGGAQAGVGGGAFQSRHRAGAGRPLRRFDRSRSARRWRGGPTTRWRTAISAACCW